MFVLIVFGPLNVMVSSFVSLSVLQSLKRHRSELSCINNSDLWSKLQHTVVDNIQGVSHIRKISARSALLNTKSIFFKLQYRSDKNESNFLLFERLRRNCRFDIWNFSGKIMGVDFT